MSDEEIISDNERYEYLNLNGSLVWNYYVKNSNGLIAKCNFCKKDYSCRGGSTKSLRDHLFAKHEFTRDQLDSIKSEFL
jgi:hypothetical protein